MNLVTVAEYVETEEIRLRVATLGVDYGQGFAIARPAPLADLLMELPLYTAAQSVTCRKVEALAGAHIEVVELRVAG
jgi:sensor c-di-GMP phosphodiesterase-like protein